MRWAASLREHAASADARAEAARGGAARRAHTFVGRFTVKVKPESRVAVRRRTSRRAGARRRAVAAVRDATAVAAVRVVCAGREGRGPRCLGRRAQDRRAGRSRLRRPAATADTSGAGAARRGRVGRNGCLAAGRRARRDRRTEPARTSGSPARAVVAALGAGGSALWWRDQQHQLDICHNDAPAMQVCGNESTIITRRERRHRSHDRAGRGGGRSAAWSRRCCGRTATTRRPRRSPVCPRTTRSPVRSVSKMSVSSPFVRCSPAPGSRRSVARARPSTTSTAAPGRAAARRRRRSRRQRRQRRRWSSGTGGGAGDVIGGNGGGGAGGTGGASAAVASAAADRRRRRGGGGGRWRRRRRHGRQRRHAAAPRRTRRHGRQRPERRRRGGNAAARRGSAADGGGSGGAGGTRRRARRDADGRGSDRDHRAAARRDHASTTTSASGSRSTTRAPTVTYDLDGLRRPRRQHARPSITHAAGRSAGRIPDAGASSATSDSRPTTFTARASSSTTRAPTRPRIWCGGVAHRRLRLHRADAVERIRRPHVQRRSRPLHGRRQRRAGELVPGHDTMYMMARARPIFGTPGASQSAVPAESTVAGVSGCC